MFSHKYRYLFIILLASYSFINGVFMDLYHYYHIIDSKWIILLTFNLIAFLVWESNRLTEAVFKKRSFARRDVRRLVMFFIVSLPCTVVASVLPLLILGESGLGLTRTELNIVTIKLTLSFGFRINLFLHCINCIIYFFGRFKEQKTEAEELRRAQTQAQLQQLKNQINPHFLFNNLNTLSSLVLQKSSEANQFIEEFAAIYRYILKNQDKDVVNVAKEFEFIRSYIFLLKKRFDQALVIEYEIPERIYSLYIVPIALQMVIENAIKHNISSEKRPLRIIFYVKDDYLYVRNNIQLKIDKEESTKIGLKNINDRLVLLGEKKLTINHIAGLYEVGIPLFKIDSYESTPAGR